MKIDRLLGITTILLNRGTVTAPELAENFSVSVRTIYRDIDILSEAGIPVFTSQGTGGGISLIEDYTIGKLPISQSEKRYYIFSPTNTYSIKISKCQECN